jgi:hypothetical protein
MKQEDRRGGRTDQDNSDIEVTVPEIWVLVHGVRFSGVDNNRPAETAPTWDKWSNATITVQFKDSSGMAPGCSRGTGLLPDDPPAAAGDPSLLVDLFEGFNSPPKMEQGESLLRLSIRRD